MAAGKYSREERLMIGRKIYECEMNRYQAAEKYGISEYTARTYLRMYKATLPEADAEKPDGADDRYEDMTKEELISELRKANDRIKSYQGSI